MRIMGVLTKLVLVSALLMVCLTPAEVSAAPDHSGRVLLVYESRRPLLVQADYVNAMTNLLGHFNLKITSMNVERYEAGLINRFDYMIYLGNNGSELPEPFISDVAVTSKPVMWINANIETLLRQRKDLGWELEGTALGMAQIEYRGRTVTIKQRQMLNSLRVGPETKVWAWAEAGSSRTPFIMSKGSLWYVARMDFWKPYYYVVADVLHDFFGADHIVRAQAFVRIEDIHPKREPAEIKAVADTLHSAGVPFMLAVIPVYYNPQTGEKVMLHEVPALTEALRDAVQQGGSIVLHGYTHQTGNSETGAGFEFWDDQQDSPLENETISFYRGLIEQAVDELNSVGLQPLAFEPPHYAISSLGYYTFAQHFSTMVAAVQLDDQTRKINQTFPYVINKDRYGLKIIPENLGYIDPTAKDPTQGPLGRAERALLVRDPMVGVFFHPYIDKKHLQTMVEGLQAKGYEFYDLSKDQHWVRTRSLAFSSGLELSPPPAPEMSAASYPLVPVAAGWLSIVGAIWLGMRLLQYRVDRRSSA